ncbi:MAG TPA: DUF6441 family protein [Longimicrobiales bacterium]
MPITVTLATSEPFREWVARNREIAERAVTAGVTAATRGALTDIRRHMTAKGLGTRFPNALRMRIYPSDEPSLGAAGSIFPNGRRADEIFEAFRQGVTITPREGSSASFLAIPTPEAGRGPRGKRITPALWEQQHGERLRFIYRRGAPSLLVAERRARRGRRGGFGPVRPGTRTGRTTVVMFILLPRVKLPKRLDPDPIARKWRDQIPGLIERALPTDL